MELRASADLPAEQAGFMLLAFLGQSLIGNCRQEGKPLSLSFFINVGSAGGSGFGGGTAAAPRITSGALKEGLGGGATTRSGDGAGPGPGKGPAAQPGLGPGTNTNVGSGEGIGAGAGMGCNAKASRPKAFQPKPKGVGAGEGMGTGIGDGNSMPPIRSLTDGHDQLPRASEVLLLAFEEACAFFIAAQKSPASAGATRDSVLRSKRAEHGLKDCRSSKYPARLRCLIHDAGLILVLYMDPSAVQ